MDLEATFYAYAFLQIGWIIASGIWLWRKHDELPLILSLFLFYVFTFRFWALLQGWTTSVNISPFGFAPVSTVYCLEADGLAVLGQTVLVGVYMLTQGRSITPRRLDVSPALFHWLRSRTFLLLAICAPLAVVTRGLVGAQMGAGKSMAFEISSYLSLFPMVLISVGILLVMVWKAGGLPSSAQKAVGLAGAAAIAWLTFSSSSRFQFLGWILAATIIVASDLRIARKSLLAVIGLVVAAALFAVAGALRGADDPEAGLPGESVNRFAFAADANMLDGFVLLRQVYPNMLGFSHGGEHLEILTRPIPRAWWPDKPVGGYINKLGMIDANTGFTLGISPSLFGSFYQEGGFIAVILLSAIYGFGFARLIRFAAGIHPVGGTLIRAITCAAVVPLLRGGDLPGIYAWFGMAFWPCFLVLWIWRKELLAKISPTPAIAPATAASLFCAPPRPHLNPDKNKFTGLQRTIEDLDGDTTTDGTRVDGSTYENVFKAKRIAGVSGLAGTWERMDLKIGSPTEWEIASRTLPTNPSPMSPKTALPLNPSATRESFEATTPLDEESATDVSADSLFEHFAWLYVVYEDDGLSFITPANKKRLDLKFDGKDYPIKGPRVAEGSTASGKRIDQRTIEISNKLRGKLVSTERMELSEDSKTLTTTTSYPGVAKPQTIVYERPPRPHL